MKKFFIYFLLVVNAFLMSYAYGLNSIRVQVVDHSLPPVRPPVKATKAKPTPAKTQAKTAATKSSGAKGKADTKSGAKKKHPLAFNSKEPKDGAVGVLDAVK